MSLAAVTFESPCRYHCSKPSAIFSERWFNTGGPCLGLSDPARSTAQLRLSSRMAIIAGSATGSVTELLGTELLALLSFSNRWLGAGAHSLGLANPSRSVDKLRLSTRVAIFTGSATDSVTELLGTEALTLLVKGSEHSSLICLLSSVIGVKCDYSLRNDPNLHNVATNT